MKDEEWRKIRNCFDKLVAELDLINTQIIDSLYSKELLSNYDKERLFKMNISLEKNRLFLEILQSKDDHAYFLFYEALREYQPHLMEMLQPPGTPHKKRGGARKTGFVQEKGRKAISDLSVVELKDWLKPLLEKEGIPLKILEVFEEQAIDGYIFKTLKENDLVNLCPELKFGHRRKLLKLSEEISPDLPAECNKDTIPLLHKTEYVRQFNCHPRVEEKYHCGKIVNIHEFRPSNLITPVRQFFPCHIESGQINLYELIANRVVVFSSACLNDRTNGTIHFGIGDVDCKEYFYGQVLGISLDKKECENAISHCIRKSFSEDTVASALQCIKPPVFISVVTSDEDESCNLFVCEVDVEPRSDWVKNLSFFLNSLSDNDNADEPVLYRLVDGIPQKQNLKQVETFSGIKQQLTEERLQQERSVPVSQKQNLLQVLKDCLCGGGDKLEGNYFPLLVIPSVAASSPEFYETFKFIFDMEWRGIFDFDCMSSEKGLYHSFEEKEYVFKIKTLEDFHLVPTTQTNPDEHFQDMTESIQKTWIFCNGYNAGNEKGLSIAEWKREKSLGYKEVVRFFKREIPGDRAVVIFLLTSKDDIFVEASEELILSFQNNWLMISESRQLADAWIDVLQKKSVISEKDKERCLTGYSFSEVNKAIQQLLEPPIYSEDICMVKTSSGMNEEIPKKRLRELCDLEIVSSTQCCHATTMSPEDINECSKEQEEKFYTGNTATWWNFYFQGHVCTRDKLPELVKYTEDTLQEVPDNENIGRVAIYHQPGAGGTTLGMNVLWKLHSEFKCCLVRHITKETAQQILTLYDFAESNPEHKKPVLAMIDNEDDEKIDDFKRNLDEECQNRGIYGVVCVFLFCFRRMSLPKEHEKKKVLLKHELSVPERQFFLDKYNDLKAQYIKSRHGKANPDNLLGLNIMKENFNEEYIVRTVRTLMNGISRNNERTLLKYLALLNAYDLAFRGIPVSCFDPLMIPSRSVRRPWENELSLKPLMTFTYNTKLSGHNKCLRITCQLLCKYILNISFVEVQNAGDIMEEFLNSCIFKGRYSHWQDFAYRELLRIINDIMKKREWVEEKRRSKFSPFVQMLFDMKCDEEAAKCMITVYEHTEDPMLAQQLARLYICLKQWNKAEEWAEVATKKWPNNSFLWDTHGQICKFRLNEILEMCEASSSEVNTCIVMDAITNAQKSVDIFNKVQELANNENCNPPNSSGYFGQMDTISLLVKILKCIPLFKSADTLHKFLLDDTYIPSGFEQLGLKHMHVRWLKTIQEAAFCCLQSVEYRMEMYSGDVIGSSSTQFFLNEQNINSYRLKLSHSFGEDEQIMSTDSYKLDPMNRQRLIRKLGGNSLFSVMRVYREGGEGRNKTLKIFELASLNLQNSKSKPTQFDYSMTLASGLCLCCFERATVMQKVNFSNLLKWSDDLIKMIKMTSAYNDLDPFLFFLLFHWPTSKRQKLPFQCEPDYLVAAAEDASNSFQQKFSKDATCCKKKLPLFFLTKHEGTASVIAKDQLQTWNRSDRQLKGINKMLKSPLAAQELERFSGLLASGGWEVSFSLGEVQGRKISIKIPLFTKEPRQRLWKKTVYFVLGFGLCGPLACDVTDELPSVQQLLMEESNFRSESTHWQQQIYASLRYDKEIADIQKQLDQIHEQHSKQMLPLDEERTVKKEQELKKELLRLQEKRRNVMLETLN